MGSFGNTGYRPTPGGARVTFNVTAPVLIKGGVGVIYGIYVNTAPAAAGGVYDSDTSGGATASTLIAAIPTTAGILEIIAPCYSGIWVNPGTGGVLSVTWE